MNDELGKGTIGHLAKWSIKIPGEGMVRHSFEKSFKGTKGNPGDQLVGLGCKRESGQILGESAIGHLVER